MVENGRMKKQHVQLTAADREFLENLIRKGQHSAKAYRRAMALLELDRGQTYTAVLKTIHVSYPTLLTWAALYKQKGLKVLEDEHRSGRPIQIDGEQRAKITALACSQPPEGYARWSLRLLADKNELKPHLKRTWCLGKLDSRFLARMELILALYALPYDPAYPVVCYDERPCFLIGDLIEPIAMQTGQIRKEHYAYEKHGSCALLAAIEPLTGNRLAQVHPQRTKKEYTLFCQALAAEFPQAVKIRIVQDNLNTHDASAFYENLPADEAQALAERFEFYYTPKSASWLNMIEIEFSALTRLCLDRRIPSQEQLEREILSLVAQRKEKKVKITWQFSVQSARSKLNAHYVKVQPNNQKFKEI
jgi:transposase